MVAEAIRQGPAIRATRKASQMKTPKQTAKAQVIEAQVTEDQVNDTAETTGDIVDVSAANSLAEIQTMIDKADATLSPFALDILRKKNEVEAAPIVLLQILQDTYCAPQGTDGNWAHPLSDFFPRPVADADAEAGSNLPLREYFKAGKPDKEGNLRLRNCNYFTEAAARTSAGKQLQFVLDQLKHFDKGGDPTKAEQKYQEMSADRRMNLGKKTRSDKSRLRSLIRRAVGIWYVMDDLAAYADRCYMEPDGVDDLSASQYPLNLIDAKRTRNYRPLSVGDVMRIDVRLAVADAGKDGSLYDAICRQLKRGSKGPTGEKATYDNVDAFFVGVRQMNNYLDESVHFDAIKGLLIQKNKHLNPEVLLELGTFVGNVNALWSPALQVAYRKIIDAQIEAAPVDVAQVKAS